MVGWEEMRLGNASAAGLVRRIDVDPCHSPVLTWRWKAAESGPADTGVGGRRGGTATASFRAFA